MPHPVAAPTCEGPATNNMDVPKCEGQLPLHWQVSFSVRLTNRCAHQTHPAKNYTGRTTRIPPQRAVNSRYRAGGQGAQSCPKWPLAGTLPPAFLSTECRLPPGEAAPRQGFHRRRTSATLHRYHMLCGTPAICTNTLAMKAGRRAKKNTHSAAEGRLFVAMALV